MKAYYVNRFDRNDRNYLFRGAMAAAGFRPEELVRHVAKHKEDYPTRESLCDAASADGFSEFFGYQRCQTWPGYGHLVCSWSVMRCWREIADGSEMAIQLLDDYYLKKKKSQLMELIDKIGDVKILQLAWHTRDDVFLLNKYDLNIAYEIQELRICENVPDVYIGASHGGSDWANVLSPEGAAVLLDYMRYHPYLNTECVLTGLHHTFCQAEGIYSVVANDPGETGTMVLRNNAWVGHLVEYTDGDMSDLIGTHEIGTL